MDNAPISKSSASIVDSHVDQLVSRIDTLIAEARQHVATVVNTTMVYTYFEIGRYLVEDEQGGNARAEYGKAVLKGVSKRLTEHWG